MMVTQWTFSKWGS